MNYGKRNNEENELEEKYFGKDSFHQKERDFQKEIRKKEKTDDYLWCGDFCTVGIAGWFLRGEAVG